MIIHEVENLLDDYTHWVRQKTRLREVDGHVEITTPYLDRHNDQLQIYVRPHEDHFVLSDDGYTLDDLTMSGLSFSTPRRQLLLNQTLNGFGIQKTEDGALEVHVNAANFSQRKHSLVQAILAVNDLFYLSSSSVQNFFLEDVEQWLDQAQIRYIAKVKFPGKTGLDHLFDFVIPKSSLQPERFIRTVNRPGSDVVKSVAFSWVDTKDERNKDTRAYAILNDSHGSVSQQILDALKSYGVQPVLWSKREDVQSELAA